MKDLPADQREQYKEDRQALKELESQLMNEDCFRLNPYERHFKDILTTEQLSELDDQMIRRHDATLPLIEREYLNRDQIDVMSGYF
jgi:hypothetical protein|tara:strand:+ start:1000 stop:1257 length:258 start_codon:yes stop_codon:yes gene_type:complete